MKYTTAKKHSWPVVLIGILFLVAAAMVPASASATLMQYTYTSNLMTDGLGNSPPAPAGPTLSITFTYDGPVPPNALIVDFSMHSGALHFSSSAPSTDSYGRVFATAGGVPSDWNFFIGTTAVSPGNYPIGLLSLYPYPFASSFIDQLYSFPPGRPFDFYTSQVPGTWLVSPVPAPGAALLLGAGLIPLAWYRRRNRPEE